MHSAKIFAAAKGNPEGAEGLAEFPAPLPQGPVAREAADLAERHRMAGIEEPFLFVTSLEVSVCDDLFTPHRVKKFERQAELPELPGRSFPALRGIRQTDDENLQGIGQLGWRTVRSAPEKSLRRILT